VAYRVVTPMQAITSEMSEVTGETVLSDAGWQPSAIVRR
jgi:hypothetical protein